MKETNNECYKFLLNSVFLCKIPQQEWLAGIILLKGLIILRRGELKNLQILKNNILLWFTSWKVIFKFLLTSGRSPLFFTTPPSPPHAQKVSPNLFCCYFFGIQFPYFVSKVNYELKLFQIQKWTVSIVTSINYMSEMRQSKLVYFRVD